MHPSPPTPTGADPALDTVLVDREASLLEAMAAIDRGGLRTALICDGAGRLLALLTDGDVRRHLLAGGSLEGPAWGAANQAPSTVGPEVDRRGALRLLMERGITCLPVVRADGVVVGLHTFRTALAASEIGSWAVVMVGGRGTRLGELTEAIPKPMLPVDGRPILEHVVRHLVDHGVRRIFLAVNYLGQMIEDHFGDGRAFHCRVEYLRESQPLGTGGPLTLLPERPREPLIVMNGDLLTKINLTRMLAFHRAGGYVATLALREHRVSVPFGVVELREGRVEALVEKPTISHEINAGIYVIEPSLLGRIPRGRPAPITELWRACLADGLRLGGYRMQQAWADVGLPTEYAEATRREARP